MAPRIRTIKPELWLDKAFGELPIGAMLLFVGLISQADDDGRFRADPLLLKAALFPRKDEVPAGQGNLFDEQGLELDIPAWLAALEAAGRSADRPGKIVLYDVHGEAYGLIPGWSRHQRVDKPRPSQLPAPPSKKKTPKRAGDSRVRRDTSPTRRGAFPTGLEGEGDMDIKTVVEQPSSSTGRSGVDQVWSAYAQRHPRAVLTDKRRRMIRARFGEGFGPERLVAAIDGNHLDPHCNGANDREQEYHDLELILRDAAHVERYEAVAAGNGGGFVGGESRLERARRVNRERERREA